MRGGGDEAVDAYNSSQQHVSLMLINIFNLSNGHLQCLKDTN